MANSELSFTLFIFKQCKPISCFLEGSCNFNSLLHTPLMSCILTYHGYYCISSFSERIMMVCSFCGNSFPRLHWTPICFMWFHTHLSHIDIGRNIVISWYGFQHAVQYPPALMLTTETTGIKLNLAWALLKQCTPYYSGTVHTNTIHYTGVCVFSAACISAQKYDNWPHILATWLLYISSFTHYNIKTRLNKHIRSMVYPFQTWL